MDATALVQKVRRIVLGRGGNNGYRYAFALESPPPTAQSFHIQARKGAVMPLTAGLHRVARVVEGFLFFVFRLTCGSHDVTGSYRQIKYNMGRPVWETTSHQGREDVCLGFRT